MDFHSISRLSVLLSKSFAQDFLKLLVTYKDISASEAASRFDLHIKTAQDFLEELFALDIVGREEVYEKKRPYFRYSLKKKKITLDIDLTSLYEKSTDNHQLELKIREKKNARVQFSTAGTNDYLTTVVILIGKGRQHKERKISLTKIQGRFLFYLPFPTEQSKSVTHILQRAGLDESNSAEILDIVELLKEYNVIEVAK
jgi:predicted transcriptional regulator